MRVLFEFFYRDLIRFRRRPMTWLMPLLFFLLVITIFVMAVGAVPKTLKVFSAAIIWIAALFASLLSQDSIFQSDYDSGFIEQVLVSPRSLLFFILAKSMVHWCISGLPIIGVMPLVLVILGGAMTHLPGLVLILLLGTFTLSLLTSFGASITLGQHNQLLFPLLVLPLSVPRFIFSILATNNVLTGMSVSAPLSLLAALMTFSLTILPLAMTGILRAGGVR